MKYKLYQKYYTKDDSSHENLKYILKIYYSLLTKGIIVCH